MTLLGRLLRQAWLHFHGRYGDPYYQQQGAFRGHVAVLCNEFTASDGEGFCEGSRRQTHTLLLGANPN